MKTTLKRITALFLVLLMTASLLASCSDRVAEKPTEEEVFVALSEASEEAMKEFYEIKLLSSPCGYFFNENCTSKILEEITDNTAEPPNYTATVETKRTWENVKVTETEEVHFTYNAETNAWEFTDYVILNLEATWQIDGEYQTESGVTIKAEVGDSFGGESDMSLNTLDYVFANYTRAFFTLTTATGEVYTHEGVKLYAPCSKGIFEGYANFATDGTQSGEPVQAIVAVYPDQITYVDHMLELYKKEILS